MIAQRDFINCALKLSWHGSPSDLLALLNGIETEMGRERVSAKDSPRIIDLDILLFGDLIVDKPELTIPHPRLHERKFVLIPCTEIEPDLIHPVYHKPLATFVSAIGEEQQIRLLRGADVKTVEAQSHGSSKRDDRSAHYEP